MVDTGIAVQEDEERPEWPSSDAVMFDPEDEDTEPTDGHSHGTFVASIIRRIAPDHQLIVARAEEMELDNLMPDDHEGDHDGPSKLTTELHIADALRRLRERTHGKKVASLNLSLGAYICDTNDDLLITMRNALRFWKVQHPSEKCDEDGNVVGTTIFAAGGNRDLSDPVYPAAFPYVRGVAAAICDVPPGDVEKDVVWKKGDASPKNADPRWWITDVAPGVDLVGNTDMSENLMKWSGSSFATAVASALNAKAKTPTEQADGKKWWLDKPLNCGDIEELLVG